MRGFCSGFRYDDRNIVDPILLLVYKQEEIVLVVYLLGWTLWQTHSIINHHGLSRPYVRISTLSLPLITR